MAYLLDKHEEEARRRLAPVLMSPDLEPSQSSPASRRSAP